MNDETRYSDLKELRLTAALAREAALREELAERNAVIDLKNRDLIEAQTAVTGWARKHAAAEQRNAELIELMKSISEPESIGEAFRGVVEIRKRLAALKPTESGGKR